MSSSDTARMRDELTGLSCLVPAYNESAAVVGTVRALHRAMTDALSPSNTPFEIIVIDDGSGDGSAETLEAANDPDGLPHRLVRHAKNRGYGAALKSGARAAVHPWLLFIDADGTYGADDAARLVAIALEDRDARMIVGRRDLAASGDPFFRRTGRGMITALARFLSGEAIPDLNSGLRLVHRDLFRRYLPLLPDTFSLTTSITLAALCSGEVVRYEPVGYHPRTGKSKIRPLPDTWRFIRLIIRTIIYFNPLKVFVPLAAVLIALSFATVVISELVTGQVMDVTATFLFIAGLQMILIGVVADLILKVLSTRDR